MTLEEAGTQKASFLLKRPLPSELKILIVNELGLLNHPNSFQIPLESKNALLALSRTSKSFNQWARPLIYQHLVVAVNKVPRLAETVEDSENGGTGLVGNVKSFCLLPYSNAAGLAKNRLEKDTNFILRRISPTVERIWFQVRVPPSTLKLLKLMSKAMTCILFPERQPITPNHPNISNLAISIMPEYGVRHTEYMKSLSSAEGLKQLIIVEPNLWQQRAGSLAPFLVELVRRTNFALRLVIVPKASDITMNSGSLYGLHGLKRGILDASEETLSVRLQEVIKVIQVPSLGVDVGRWVRQKFLDGTIWDCDTVAFTECSKILSAKFDQ